MADTENPSVLIVDDDPEISWGVGRCLTRAGCAVATCTDGEEAISLLQDKRFDFLITDVQMPRMNGLSLVEWVAEHRRDTRIVVMTAFGSQSVQHVVLQKGAVLYLEKPFDPNLLKELILAPNDGKSFSGSVEGVSLFDYIQLIFHTMRQALVRIHSSDGREGMIYIKDGTAWHAECGDIEGDEAFYACLAFGGGSFSTMPWEEPTKRTIETRGDFLLLDAARAKDESSRAAIREEGPNDEGRISDFDFSLRDETDATAD